MSACAERCTAKEVGDDKADLIGLLTLPGLFVWGICELQPDCALRKHLLIQPLHPQEGPKSQISPAQIRDENGHEFRERLGHRLLVPIRRGNKAINIDHVT